MDKTYVIAGLINLFRIFLPVLVQEKLEDSERLRLNPKALAKARELKDILSNKGKQKPIVPIKQALIDALNDVALAPDDDDAAASLRLQLKKLFDSDYVIYQNIDKILEEIKATGFNVNYSVGLSTFKWFETLDKSDDTLKRLEMIRQFRIGVPQHQITEQFKTDIDYLHRLNSAFSCSGTQGVISGSNVRHWLDTLDRNDHILRRFDMISQLRAGTPPEAIARQYNTLPDYIYRISERFERYGAIGIMTEEDFRRYRQIYPDTIRICSFNLHGTQPENDYIRFRRIAQELSAHEPDICAFQEVINGSGIEETSAQIATWLTNITGYHYRTYYGYCHMFMDKYPEGIAVSAKYGLKNQHLIDLNKDLRDGARPIMERFSTVSEVEVHKKRVIFASVHLDHSSENAVKPAQVEKLISEIERIYRPDRDACIVLAGDFNDVEGSETYKIMLENGFVDAYRTCHKSGGNTFSVNNPHTRIDYIMVKGNVKFISAELILKDAGLSDHIGLLAVIQ